MSRVKTFRIAMCIGIVSAYCQTAGGTLITPNSVTSSTAATDLWPAENLRNNSGLIGDLADAIHCVHYINRADNSWATSQSDNSTDYYAPGVPHPFLICELDEQYTLESIVLWNYAADGDAGKNSAKSITVAFSQNGVDFSGDVQITLCKGIANIQDDIDEPAQIFSLGGVRANAVRLTITDNFWDGVGDQGGGDRVGLSEVKFLAPEPSSLLLTGIGLFGLVSFVFLRINRKTGGLACSRHALLCRSRPG